MKIENIETGDCMLVSTDSSMSKMIQWFQKRTGKEGYEYNHAGMFWWCYDKLFIIEAIKSGIAITPFDDYLKREDKYKKIMVIRPKFEYSGSKMGKFMLRYCGRSKYGFFNLIFAQALKILTFNRLWIGPLKEKGQRFICGEWVVFVWEHFNFFSEDVDTGKIAPVDIYNFNNIERYFIR